MLRWIPRGGHASLTPDTSAAYGAGWVDGCWVQYVGGALTVERNLGTNAAIGSEYNATNTSAGNDAVVMLEPQHQSMFGPGEIGVSKLATNVRRLSGAARRSNRRSDAGAVIGLLRHCRERDHRRDDPSDGVRPYRGVTAATDVGGAASDDGGTTFHRATFGDAWSVAEWQGSSGDWLLFGQNEFGTNRNLLAAFRNWSHSTPPVAGGNVSGSTASDLHGTTVFGPVYVDAIAGIPGQDEAFIGATVGALVQNGPPEAAVVRASLAPGPALSDLTPIGRDVITKRGPIADRPSSASAPAIGDVLMVVSEDPLGGALFRVTNATGHLRRSPPSKRSRGHGSWNGLPALRVDCRSGTVWVASGDPGDGLLRSTDGGQTFTHVPVPALGGGPQAIRALGMAPGDPAEVLVGDSAGYLQSSGDGGTTWTLVNRSRRPDIDLAAPPPGFTDGGIWDLVLAPVTGSAAIDARRAPARDLVAGPGEFIGRPVTRAVPALSKLRLTNRTFRVGGRATPVIAQARARAGTTITFATSRAATASITFARLVAGYRAGRRCVTRTKPRGRRRRCTLLQPAGTLVRQAKAGADTIAFTGRIGKRALRPGRYRLTITARIGDGPRSRSRQVKFRVVRR